MQIHNDSSITFRGETFGKTEINKACNKLMRMLACMSIEKDEVVAIALPRSFHTIVAMYTLYRLGIPYLILDLTLPDERIAYMLENAQVRLIIADSSVSNIFEDKNILNIDSSKMSDEVMKPLKSSIMYLAYTSGTTGKPKGVEIRRKGFDCFAKSFIETGVYKRHGKIICLTSFTFDIIYCETLIPLFLGMNIVLVNSQELNNIKRRCEIIKENHINFIQCTPSAIAMMNMYDGSMSFLDNVDSLVLGGEACPESLLNKLAIKKNLRIMNFYGPTETTVWSTYSDLSNKKSVDIGKPLSNTEIYILDDSGKAVAEGEHGEICIGGKSLAAGYRGNREATKKAFGVYGGKRIYRTGDIGHIENGLIYCHGRKDFQIKILGHRIETDEIDSRLMQIDGINNCVTAAYPTEIGQELISFYQSEKFIDASVIKKNLADFLPDYMIPAVYVRMDNLAYTSSGKTDRNKMISDYLESLKTQSICDSKNNSDGIFGEIVRLIGEKMSNIPADISPNTLLSSIFINSVVYVSMVVFFEEKYDFEFEDEYLNTDAFKSLGELAAYIGKAANC